MRTLCLHGHFYQPPREHPWLGVVEPEASAAPARDWNTRITAECYAPNAAARVFDRSGRLRALVNTYEWTSFDFGPTLLSWLAPHAPEVMTALRRADAASLARTGHGNAWAQAYGHAILPLSTARDVRTQVLWGRRDFEHRFGRAAEGMWLPEMAVDRTTLRALAEAGITLTMLAPHQALRRRPLGASEAAWEPVTPASLDTRKLYRCRLEGGLAVDVVFRDASLSHDVAFGELLLDGARFARHLRDAVEASADPAIVALAVDGETYGHHHRFGEMALGFALQALQGDPELTLAGPAAFRTLHPPADEVEIAEATSWSCPHGVERWRAGCGCRVGGPPEWSQAWRAPLRQAIDWLRDELAAVYEAQAGAVLRDPWGARDRYVDCVLDPARLPAFLAEEGPSARSPAAVRAARRMLELARHALLMQTSCGWFFDELTGIEPVQILRYAARAIDLASGFGSPREAEFVERLEPARSNLPAGETGAELYRRAARGEAATAARVAATGAMMALLGHEAEVPGYELAFSAPPADGRLSAEARVVERSTGTSAVVAVAAERLPGGAPESRVEGRRFTLADAFGVQREWVIEALGRDAAAAARAELERTRPLLEPLLARGAMLPPELAALLGWEAAEMIVGRLEGRAVPLATLVSEAAALVQRGVRFPARWLGRCIVRELVRRLDALPESAGDALALLELAKVAGVQPDVGPAQVRALAWWLAAPVARRSGAALETLRERLGLAPEEA